MTREGVLIKSDKPQPEKDALSAGKDTFSADRDAHPQSIVGENGVYVIDETGVRIIAKSETIKDKKPIDHKMVEFVNLLFGKKPDKND